MSAAATRQLRAWMAGHEAEMIAFLGRIVDMDTSTLERAGVEALAGLMTERFRALGFAVERRDSVEPPHAWITAAFLEGRGAGALAPAVAARLGGGQGQGRLLLVAHLDTAFPPGAPAASPFRVADGRAYGPAVADMKGGVVGVLDRHRRHDGGLRREPARRGGVADPVRAGAGRRGGDDRARVHRAPDAGQADCRGCRPGPQARHASRRRSLPRLMPMRRGSLARAQPRGLRDAGGVRRLAQEDTDR
jgi:hypothetical protein